MNFVESIYLNFHIHNALCWIPDKLHETGESCEKSDQIKPIRSLKVR